MSRNKTTNDQPERSPLIRLRVVLILTLSATAGVLVGLAAGVEAGCATGLAVATTLERLLHQKE